MITQKPTTSRRPLRVASTAFAALLLLGLPLAAQRSAHGTGGGGHSSGGSHSSGGGGSHSGGGSGGSGHTAHGVPGGGGSSGGGQRQPRGNGHGGGYYGGHGGYWHGGHFYYYPWGWGFWPSFSWWYGDPYYYGPYGYGYGYGYYGGPRYYDRSDMGALDLDVSPGRTHVFVNGEDLGEVDRYDGWPGYLWLPRGTYDVAFYLDGFKTIARQITIYPGTVIDIDDRMEQGASTRPEDLVSKTHERRDERMQYERERSDRIDRGQYGDDDDQDWHDRVRRDRDGRGYDRDRGGDRADGSRGHLRLSVQPDDASVYLDGQFIGTGTDLSLLRGGLAVGPGTHHLAVVRPGHKAVERDFTVKEGEDVRLEIALESGSR